MTREEFITIWRLGYAGGFKDGIEGRVFNEAGAFELFNDARMNEDLQRLPEGVEVTER